MPAPVWDPLGRRTILLAPERASRGAPPVPTDPPDPAPCDFCGGMEDRTPPETLRIPGSGPWRVRVVPNLYPATRVHEVVIHTPEHDTRFEDMPHDARAEVVSAYRQRVSAADTAAVLAAVNRGRAAGASRSHEHGQIFGLDAVPPALARECDAFAAEPCVACAIRDAAPRVAEHGQVAVVANPAPLVAHELLVIGAHAPRFDRVEQDDALADAIASALDGCRRALGDGAALNLVVHTAPRSAERFHWHAHLYPRTSIWGALELGAELPIVAADPAESARRFQRPV